MGHDLALVAGTVLGLSLLGHPLRAWFRERRVPPAVSLIGLGLLLGPEVAGLLPGAYLEHSQTLSKAAFVVLLLRAGLGLVLGAIGAIVVSSLAFGLLPVAVELAVVSGMMRWLVFDDPHLALLAGFLAAAASPAVILPTMLQLKEAGLGGPRCVPDRIVGQTLVNAFVAQTGILLLLGVLLPGTADGDPWTVLGKLPISIAMGIVLGSLVGFLLPVRSLLRSEAGDTRWRGPVTTAVVLAAGLGVYFGCREMGFESVFATLATGTLIGKRLMGAPVLKHHLRQVWGTAEIVLFVNIGAAIDLHHLWRGWELVTLLAILAVGLAGRVVSAMLLTRASSLVGGERTLVVFAQVPKATIQAVFGALPLVMFTRHRPELIGAGHHLLMLAALAILFTAPAGAVLLERFGQRCLRQDEPKGAAR